MLAEVDTSSDDEEVVDAPSEQILPPSPPPPTTTPPLTAKQIANLQALDNLQYGSVGAQELYNYFNTENKEELVQQEEKDVVNDSFLSSVPSASDAASDYSSDEEEDEGDSDSSGGESFIYHAVGIQGRGYVAVYRSKRAPKYKLYYFTASNKKAYLTKKHILALKRVEYHMLKSTDPTAFMNSPAHGCLHKGDGTCWCNNLNYYIDELYDL